MDERIANFVETVRARNVRESVAAAIVIAFLGYRLVAEPEGLSHLGAWIVIVACLGIIALTWTVLNIPSDEPSAKPLAQHPDHWRQRMTTQATALRFAWLWYVLPLLGGVAVIVLGRGDGFTTGTVVSLAVLVGLGLLLSYANFSAANRMERDRDALFEGAATTKTST